MTKRLAENRLRNLRDEARRGTLPGMVRTGATFADAAAEWLRYREHDRLRKPSTVATYRSLPGSQILPTFADQPIEAITTAMVDSWIARDRTAAIRVKLLAMVYGIFKRARKVWALKVNPAVDVEKPPLRGTGDIEVFSRSSVRQRPSRMRRSFLTAAFSGLRRGELIALRWRDVDFAGSVIRVRASYSEACSRVQSPARSARSRWRPTSCRHSALTSGCDVVGRRRLGRRATRRPVQPGSG